jgi:formylglycine-generating enzyme required for sulfatase activity/tetratricopeptide (TPR) repeat protein
VKFPILRRRLRIIEQQPILLDGAGVEIMAFVCDLIAFGLRQTLDLEPEGLLDYVERRFVDHGHVLPQAVRRANDRSWKSLALALGGDGWLDRAKGWFCSSGDERGFRDQVRAFLQTAPLPPDAAANDFRQECLRELQELRKKGQLSVEQVGGRDLAERTASLRRHVDPNGLVDAAREAVAAVAERLEPEAPQLAALLRLPTPANGPPLIVAAFVYFFRREVEEDDELAHGLFFDNLRQLTASQARAFGEVRKALNSLGDRLDDFFEAIDGVRVEVGATRQAVLDLHEELQRLGGLQLAGVDELRRLMTTVLDLLGRSGMQRGEVKPHHSLSIRGAEERHVVRHLLDRFRRLPPESRERVPALLNGLGKLQLGAGDFEEARRTFAEVAAVVAVPADQAEARYNAYRAALEERDYDDALAALTEAATLDPKRFAPFPMSRYQPQRILGAGGFGTVVLCRDSFFLDREVAVKALHADDLERRVEDVFAEAHALMHLSHPAIIGVHDCSFADVDGRQRPYVVMPYFEGRSLEAHVLEDGPLSVEALLTVARQVADGMHAAHQKDVLHRDLKPDNVLVRLHPGEPGPSAPGGLFQVKVIDFGLALRRPVIETSLGHAGNGDTVQSGSVLGTMRYAPPEQKGELPGVRPGRYSDVYAFGKLCCFALFKTTEPRLRHLNALPAPLRDLLDRCIDHDLEHRWPDFAPILEALDRLAPRSAEAERQDRIERQRREGEAKLAHALRDLYSGALTTAFNAVQGLWSPGQEQRQPDNLTGLRAIAEEHGIADERLNEIHDKFRRQWRKAHPPRRDRRPGDPFLNDLGMKFAWIPPGTFLMGGAADDPDRLDNETPHRVTLTSGFWMGVHPVTQAQWRTLMGVNPSCFQDDARPVEMVSWDDCREFLRRLSRSDGRTYRLPTEAEWEYACRAGTTTPFSFGATLRSESANYDPAVGSGSKAGGGQTTAVGSFAANAWGLFDMHGNVWEWCADWYDEYDPSAATDPQGPRFGTARVLRGGSWGSKARGCRAACRNGGTPGLRNNAWGFRVVLQAEG